MLIKGITVTLYERVPDGVDGLGNPIYTVEPVEIKNVLVMPTSNIDLPESTTITGKGQTYTIGIPKGDTHEWTDSRVDFLGGKFKTSGFVDVGIEANIPTAWHKKISAVRYE